MSIADIIVIGMIVLCLAGIVWYYVKRQKKGEVGCGCGCSGCQSSCNCDTAHKEK